MPVVSGCVNLWQMSYQSYTNEQYENRIGSITVERHFVRQRGKTFEGLNECLAEYIDAKAMTKWGGSPRGRCRVARRSNMITTS